MKREAGVLLVALVLAVAGGCGGDSGGGVVTRDCSIRGSATMTFQNAASGQSHSVEVDGVAVAELAPGESRDLTVAAGRRDVDWFYGGTTVPSRPSESVEIPVCAERTLSCDAPFPGSCLTFGLGTLVATNTHLVDVYCFVDDLLVFILTPGRTQSGDLTAGPHVIEFRYRDGVACSAARYTIEVCRRLELTC